MMKIFDEKAIKKLGERLNIANKMAVPRPIKVVINVGIGNLRDDKNKEQVSENLASISGQKPKETKARESISGFKIRKNEAVGLMVTLRGRRMFDFLLKLANVVLPRLRDFRGLSEKSFDKNGNFTLGFSEQIVFPEISHEKAETLHGLSITIATTAKNTAEGRMLLEELGFPFKKT